MAAGEGGARHGVEAVRLQHGAQLRQGVVVGPVAEGDHPHRQGAIAVDLLPDEGQHLVGQLPRIGGHGKHHQIARVKLHGLPPVRRAGEVPPLQGDAQLLRQGLRNGVCRLVRIACGAPIDRPDPFHTHLSSLPFLL